jgi:hypothetical protein
MNAESGTRTLEAKGQPQDVEDDVLQEMAADAAKAAGPVRRGGGDATRGLPSTAPFNLSIPAPRAIDLRRLWKLAKKDADPMIVAGFGHKVPVLLSHGVTAQPAPGRKPAKVWGMGYKVELFDVQADTVDVQPSTELLDIATVGAEASVDIGLDGSLEVPKVMHATINTVPGVSLTAAKIGASIDENAKLSISFTVSVPKVISGPGDGFGGAEWSLYAQDKQIAGFQALLQTLLVPRATKRLQVGITSWVREAGFLGRPKEWLFDTASFTIDVDR